MAGIVKSQLVTEASYSTVWARFGMMDSASLSAQTDVAGAEIVEGDSN